MKTAASSLAIAGLLLTSGCGFLSSQPATSVEAEPHTSQVALQHVGEVVFAKQPIPRGPESADAFVREFTLDDSIYMRPFLVDSFANMLQAKDLTYTSSGEFLFSVQVNQEQDPKKWITVDSFSVNGDAPKVWRTFSPRMDGNSSLTEENSYPEFNLGSAFQNGVLPRLRAGTNQITVRVFGRSDAKRSDGEIIKTKELLAEGSFALSIKKGEISSFLAKRGPRLAKAVHLENAQLVPRYRELAKERWPSNAFVGAATQSADWVVSYRNRVPSYRQVDAVIVLRDNDAPLQCTIYEVGFAQNYLGSRNQYEDKLHLRPGDRRSFPCDSAPGGPGQRH